MSTAQADMLKRITAKVSDVLGARLKGLAPDAHAIEACADLRELGLDSLGAVNLMLSLESEFDLFIPQDRIKPQNFRSVGAIMSLMSDLAKVA